MKEVTQEEKAQIIKDYLKEIAVRGGRVKSPAKAAACRLNGSKPKVRKSTDKISIDKQSGLGVD